MPTPIENTPAGKLPEEAQRVREVLVEVTLEKGLGSVDSTVKRTCLLLDPRRKQCSSTECLNGGDSLRRR